MQGRKRDGRRTGRGSVGKGGTEERKEKRVWKGGSERRDGEYATQNCECGC